MRNTRKSLAVVLMGIVCVSASIVCPTGAKAEDAPAIGDIRTQKLRGFTYFYGSVRVTLLTFPFKVAALIPELQKALDSAHARATGPMVLIYHGPMDEDTATAECEIQIGFPVAGNTPAAKDFKVRDVPDYSCMSLIYSGSIGGIMPAYEKLVPAADDAGARTDETRVMFLYIEGADSANNVLHISVGMKQ